MGKKKEEKALREYDNFGEQQTILLLFQRLVNQFY